MPPDHPSPFDADGGACIESKSHRSASPHLRVAGTGPARPKHDPQVSKGVSTAFIAPNKAVGSYTETADADFKDYQIVAAVGDDATLEDAIVLETRPERTPAPFETLFGLAEPDSIISIWVIVRTHDGNERASEKSIVHRPE